MKIRDFFRKLAGVVTIEWLDAEWTRAAVTEYRFGGDRFTEVENRDIGKDYDIEVWYHVGSEVPIEGDIPWVMYDYTISALHSGSGLQRMLTKARCKNLRRLRQREQKRIRQIAETEEHAQWKTRAALPAAVVHKAAECPRASTACDECENA